MANFYGNDPFFNNDMDDIFNQVFKRMGNPNSDSARYLVNGQSLTPDEFAQYRATGKLPEQAKTIEVSKDGQQALKKGGILEKLGTNLTEQARDGLLDSVIGRENEIQETAEILSRRTKNNPILVGDAGVGKTAIVEGLAQAIVNGKVPEAIRDKEIYSIDLSSLEAGTQYRGSFEENIKDLVKEVKAAGNIILFFDEIHQIIGTGSTGGEDGGKGLADIIKPALSRGELTVIGATTQDEYRNTILKNAALARRFNDVVVNEPNAEDTLKILKGIKNLYEEHHHVKLPDDVLKATVDYSIQYIPQRTLPDKAIDLIDMTAAHLAAHQPENDETALKEKLNQLQKEKDQAVEKEDFKRAADLKQQIEATNKQIDNVGKKEEVVATVDDVAQSVERLTGIPVSDMGANDIERLKDLDSRLKSKVIGQDEAVAMVARAIRRNRAGFSEGEQPIGSFLFVGPTGVGKTELAKQLALDMFGDKDAIIRLDMSEYSDRTAVSKLIGTSAGYVGYDDNSNTLTERVRRNPYSIVLLDEIEKADPQVLTLLLQVMDDGRLTDGQGNVINFKNTIIIATSNAGFGNEKLTGDADKDQTLMDKLAPFFRPEFLNRFNGIVEFSHLTKKDLSQIVDLMISDVQKTLAKKDLTLKVTDAAKDWLMEQGYDEAMGARPLRRVIEQQIRDKVTDFYLDHLDIKHLKADLKDDQIVIEQA
ncbi:MAG: ATP-dependent Clp protease ATP-binding subunit [Pediococcus pentosaceus]|jgi:ATP-dependent Clp protease ATP-binding subunit ClpL|uniref:ATP-dependent Clp protease ATP-binding subunit n=1 Tax=Pediococcus pentosaceus TaxID=1255 RepID=UPI001009376F|nr:ATP-dependent Clp protease ATP-binding subunit [Pediococcus pentosaceus]MCD5256722.1 ATP-dependent Clp protease ATP-binding subunit [Pediococcus pentosaceus]MCH4016745.1 ATP-dependent Clp protease ATP-binding subunit [Pediococcus pentosaceus]MCH4098698.1 ATP-dependent Clp protease ATP-binding subunit [Pediococcus pentosaceus]MCI1285211.1 ATP-dependent Clp protease ATP-binding subunit [Pediococcus pentosaceus]MCI1348119.1 ATP-dependent Clp protease ATP-binding subunit [Pediococcus pentosaceu